MHEIVDMMLQMVDELKELKVLVEALKKSRAERLREAWLDGAEVEQVLGISTRTLHRMRERGELPASLVGNKLFYKLADIEALLDNGYRR